MFKRSSPFHTPWGALFFAMLGLAWCGYISFPTTNPAPCISSGCALFKDMRIAGISLWWVGGLYFFLLAIVCLRGRAKTAWYMARIGLALDCLLLLIMFFIAPCRDCLVVAACLGMVVFMLRPGPDEWFNEGSRPSILLPLWFGLFLGNAILFANEALPTYSIGSAENSAVRIYFSPSCPACRDALATYGQNAVLYPVVERDGDAEAIRRLAHLLEEKVPMGQALLHCFNPKEQLPHQSLLTNVLFTLQLTRNKAAVLKQGFSALPLIEINGMPRKAPSAKPATPSPTATPELAPVGETAIGAQTPRGPRTASPNSSALDLPWDTRDLTRCTQSTPEPCPDQ